MVQGARYRLSMGDWRPLHHGVLASQPTAWYDVNT
jgi:hypothetical protein